MRLSGISLGLICAVMGVFAQEQANGPTNEKAQKTYKKALEFLRRHDEPGALEDFKKADKQDGGHCFACQRHMIRYGMELGDWKTAEQGAEEMVAEAKSERDTALAHYQLAVVFTSEGFQKHKDEFFGRAHEEIGKALAVSANFPDALFTDGRVLAQLRQDDAAKDRFEQFVKMKSGDDPNRQRALRYISHPELARARMAPAFAITTVDAQRISLDDLQGKVVLLDFWATWCAPCREALPHVREIARKFQGQPLVILSVSLDDDEQKIESLSAKTK